MVETTARIRPTDGTKRAMRSLARRWLVLNDEITELERALGELVQTQVPGLLERPGIGVVTAAQLLVTAGANPTGCTARERSPRCAERPRSRLRPARPSVTG